MTDFNNYYIYHTSTIVDALKQLDNISGSKIATLFAIDSEECLLGTVTDGDIRRALIKGAELSDTIDGLMNKNFHFFREGEIDIKTIPTYKDTNITLIPVLNDKGMIVKVINLNTIKTFLPVDAVLMAGGKGERLRPLTLKTPKPLLKVGDKPIIDYNIENLLQNGVENISVTVNYLKEQIEEHFAAPRDNGVKVNCVGEPEFLGTMGSIKYITEWHNDYILVMNSDLFTNINLENFFIHFLEHDADMSVAAVPYSVAVPYGIFEIDNKREIKGIKEKPTYHYYANAGIYLIKRSLLELIPDGEFFNATDLISQLITLERKVIRYPLSGYWIDIGKPEDFKKVQDYARHINKL